MKGFPLRSIFRSAGTLTATAILIFALIVAVSGTFSTRAELHRAFEREMRIQTGQLSLESLLKLQLDEETSVRGYTITHDDAFLQPYFAAAAKFSPLDAGLGPLLRAENLSQASAALEDFRSAHAAWHRDVADPIVHSRGGPQLDLEKRGKLLIDQERTDATVLEAALAQRADQVGQQTQDAINYSLYVRAFWLVVFGLLAILFNMYRSRLNRELEEERTVTQTLQRAFESEFEPIEGSDVGSMYISADVHAAVGGDMFDLYKLGDHRALALIADVSGKGVDAAVLTAFIKFTIRGIALRRGDPADILSEFNTAFPRTVRNPYLFVSMFVAIIDFQKGSLAYASGGHDSVYLRRSDASVEQLMPTGPILGVMEEAFESRTLEIEAGDTLLLATDGLTEARNAAGRFYADDVASIVSQTNGTAQHTVEVLTQRVLEYTGNHMTDDLAMLAVRFEGLPAKNA